MKIATILALGLTLAATEPPAGDEQAEKPAPTVEECMQMIKPGEPWPEGC